MRIGEHQSIIGVHVPSGEHVSYEELHEILDGDEFQQLLQGGEFVESVIGRTGSPDEIQAIADICNLKPSEVKPGDYGVVFRRLPLTGDDELLLISLRDIAEKFLVAVASRRALQGSKTNGAERAVAA